MGKHHDPPDSWRMLGLPVGASVPEINRAYRAAVRRCHPDHAESASPEHSLAELQHARHELLRYHHQRHDHQTVPTTHPPAQRRLPLGYPPGGPDISVGPVRYHGPAASRAE